jgi:hypothetical protein
MGWARLQFIDAAAGQSPATFGPVFVAAVAVQTTVTTFLIGPVVGALLGFLVGSRHPDLRSAVVVSGGGALLGFYLMAGLALVGVLGGLSGVGTGQVYGVRQVLGPFVLSGVPALVAGGVAGALGSLAG